MRQYSTLPSTYDKAAFINSGILRPKLRFDEHLFPEFSMQNHLCNIGHQTKLCIPAG